MLWLLLAGTACHALAAPAGHEAGRVLAQFEAAWLPASPFSENPNLLVKKAVVNAEADAGSHQIDDSQSDWYERYRVQKGAPDPVTMTLNTDPEPNLEGDGFEPLYNGKDLTGWRSMGGKCEFSARGGQIVGVCVPGSPSTYLCTERNDYKDFLFTCRMKWEVDGNSGVMFRSVEKPSKRWGTTAVGPQAEMEGFEKGRGWSGGIYGQGYSGFLYPLWLEQHTDARAALKEGDWNRLTILAEGPVVKTWINGVPVAHWTDTKGFSEGFFGLQIHSGKQGTVVWEDLRVKRLPGE